MWYLGEVHSKQRGKQLPSPLGTEMLKIMNETGKKDEKEGRKGGSVIRSLWAAVKSLGLLS